ncbi:MAG: NUDIX hydrolase [Micrococcales bacterium]|nr:MAG: NUDIX hydrolase [Micrococcales bacterium]
MPEVPVSAGAILLDPFDRVLILKPTYKSGWTIPGGVMEADGESPWDACRREVREETGLVVRTGRLVCVDTRPAKRGRKLGLRFLFHCGHLSAPQADSVAVDGVEISEHRFVPADQASTMLRPAVSRRVLAALGTQTCRYLEDGRDAQGCS